MTAGIKQAATVAAAERVRPVPSVKPLETIVLAVDDSSASDYGELGA